MLDIKEKHTEEENLEVGVFLIVLLAMKKRVFLTMSYFLKVKHFLSAILVVCTATGDKS